MKQNSRQENVLIRDDNRKLLEWNRQIIAEFRVTGGKPGGQIEGFYPLGQIEGCHVLLLTTIGARSGQFRTNPLLFLPYHDRFVVFATKGGSPTHPAWYHNLMAYPQATIEVGSETFKVIATVATGEQRNQLYAAQVKFVPIFAEFEAKATRQIPVIILERHTAHSKS